MSFYRKNNGIIKFCPRTRKTIVQMRQEGKPAKEIAEDLKTSRTTVYRWSKRYKPEKELESLSDKSTAPKRCPRKTPRWLERTVIKIRDEKNWSSQRIHLHLKNRGIINPSTGKHLSEYAIRSIFERYKRGYKWDKLKRKKPVIIRYEREKPGELAHIDVKKLKNVRGENTKHKKYEVAVVDDATRIAYIKTVHNKKAVTLALFLKEAYFFFKKTYGITIESLLSDNGKEFTYHEEAGMKFHSFELMCRMLKIKHKYTKVYRPQTNGKVERLWRTLDTELFKRIWFKSFEHRNKELKEYNRYYNNYRIHLGINGLTPVQKLKLYNEKHTEKIA